MSASGAPTNSLVMRIIIIITIIVIIIIIVIINIISPNQQPGDEDYQTKVLNSS